MEAQIQIQGTQEFMGVEIPIIEGGFGEGKRCITDKNIGEIHNQKVKHIREKINDYRDKFKDNIDIIDLKVVGDTDDNLELLKTLGYNKMQISKSEHIYLLSERGYLKLVKIMNTDKAWDIYENLIDDYFTLKQLINDKERLLADTFYKSIFSKTEDERINNTKMFGELKEEYGREKQKEEDEKLLIEERVESFLSTEKMIKDVDKTINTRGFFQALENKGYGRNKLVKERTRFISNDKFENEFIKNGLCRKSSTYIYTWSPLMIDYLLNNNELYELSIQLTKMIINDNLMKRKKKNKELKGYTIFQACKHINTICNFNFTKETFTKFLVNLNWITITNYEKATPYAKENNYAFTNGYYVKLTEDGINKIINMFK